MKKILYSPRHGAGWSTWAISEKDAEKMLTYQPIIDAIERGEQLDENHPLCKRLQKECDKDICLLGARNLRVMEVHDGFTPDHLDVFDGKEGLDYS